MENRMTPEKAKQALLELFKDAGRTDPGLLEYVESLSRENGILKQELRKRRAAGRSVALRDGGNNSRLYDALRE
ncbi:hypothetical protein ACFSL6_21495 [Paenibacillus thailandensis]|uniref:Uncharacterized protein n=1 Tax=Paenibacillus thailandensis TaxID=393250 RepID=A0ABW5R3I6_9BACL